MSLVKEQGTYITAMSVMYDQCGQHAVELLCVQARIERERKDREKQKKKDKIQRQKEQGTYLTAKQKEDRRRAQQMLDAVGQKGRRKHARLCALH